MEKKQQVDRIKRLMDQYLGIVHSERNQKNIRLWKDAYNWNRDRWRGGPADNVEVIPYTISLGHSMWSKILNISMSDYNLDPYSHMEMQLGMKIYHFEKFNDNTPVTDELYIWFGPSTELSIFGCEPLIFNNKESWIKGPLIKEYEDADSLLIQPDFYKSGIMPRIHRFYEVMSEVADGKLKVMFPNFARGPFCIATHLRGMEDMLVDLKVEPDFVHRLMRFVTDSHKSWTEERNKFVKEEKFKTCLFNDEVDSPTISPSQYGEFILPYEKELEAHYGGVRYWHSCGNTTPFLSLIRELPIDLFHVGPWTSYKEADDVFEKASSLDICLHPMRDVLEADEEQMNAKLVNIKESCKHKNFAVRADTFMPQGDIHSQIDKINKWAELAYMHLNQNPD